MTELFPELHRRDVATTVAKFAKTITTVVVLASCATSAVTTTPPVTPPATTTTSSVTAPPPISALYIGSYEVRPGADFLVTTQDGKLFGDFPARPGFKREMRATSGTTFELGNEYRVVFEVDGMGIARAATLVQGDQTIWRALRHGT